MNKDEFVERLKQAADEIAVLDQQVLKKGKHIAKGDHYSWQGESEFRLKGCCGTAGVRWGSAGVVTIREALEDENICGGCLRSLVSRTDYEVERVVIGPHEEIFVEKS